MLNVPGQAKIFLYASAVSMRKSFEGLSTLVQEAFSGQLTTGAYFVFLNRERTHIKVLFWDGDGFAIWYKRLEKGLFARVYPKSELTRREFLMLIEGITPRRLNLRYKVS